LDAAGGEQVRDAVGEDPRLPRAGAGDDEQRPFRGQHGLALGVVQVGEVDVRLRDGHAARLLARRADTGRQSGDMAVVRGIEIAGLVKSYGAVKAVRGIDVSVDAGETVALLGPNGAGKSTTIDLLLGLLQPDGGSVSVFGKSPQAAVTSGEV